MITGRVTQNGIGIEFVANQAYLCQLHAAIHDLTEAYTTEVPELNVHFLLSLAYDIRKAYEGQRGVTTLAQVGEQEYQLYHNQVIWPIYLGQVSMLRYLSKQSGQHEALIHSLTRCAVTALKKVDIDTALEVEYWLSRVKLKPDYASLIIQDVAARFINGFERMEDRIAALPAFLDMLKPSGDVYQSYKRQLIAAAKIHDCSIYQLRPAESEFPEDFEW